MTTIVTKNGSGAPLASDLVQGELAVDLTNKRLYTEDSGGSVIEVGTSPSTIDINAGTIDGTVIGGSSAAAGTFTTFTSTGIDDNATSTAITIDASENVGIGTGSPNRTLTVSSASGVPAELVSSSSNSLLAFFDSGTGVRPSIGSEGSDLIFNATSERMRINSSGNVGIGTASPDGKLNVFSASAGSVTADADADELVLENSGNVGLSLLTASTGESGIYFGNPGTNGQKDFYLKYYHESHATTANRRAFTFNTASTERMRIDSSGNVGIGTDTVSFASGYTTVNINGSTGGQIHFSDDDVKVADFTANTGNLFIQSSGVTSFRTGGFGSGDEAMRIDSSGNVGIGTNSITTFGGYKTLHFKNTAGDAIQLNETDGGVINQILCTDSSGGKVFLGARSNHPTIFCTNDTERMRIDSSGNLLVGKTSTDNTTNGFVLDANGTLNIVRSSEYLMRLNRTTTDGEILRFQKDGTTVGSIGTSGGNLFIEKESNAGFQFGSSGQIVPRNSGATSDNTVDLGSPSVRFDDIYATNGTIQTSDVNEKQDIEALSEAEQRVAVAAKGLLRKFRWRSAVEEKGDDARIHFGIIAQDLQAAFEAEGLDAGDYGMFIHSTWTDEETGEERSRMGVRYSELLAFIIAAI